MNRHGDNVVTFPHSRPVARATRLGGPRLMAEALRDIAAILGPIDDAALDQFEPAFLAEWLAIARGVARVALARAEV